MNSQIKLREVAYFSIIFFLQIFLYVFIILQKRIPAGWDTFQYFHLQYYFLNNKIISGEISHWMPYMTHGTVSTWWYTIQAGIVQNILLQPWFILTDFLEGTNFLVIFNLGMFFDEILLILGTWLLSKKLFRFSLTAFFVTLTIAGSSIWMVQIWYNFHFFYAIPLVLYFGHRFIDTQRWRYFFLAGNLLAIQILGHLPYCITIIILTVFLYFLLYLICHWQDVFQKIKKIKINFGFLLCLIAVGLSFYAAFSVVHAETRDIVSYNYQRNVDMKTNVEWFLSYGRNLGLKKWIELLLGVSPNMDCTLFVGFLPLFLCFVGLIFNRKKENQHILVLIVVLFLFSGGTFVAKIFYFFWPMMKYYRHLSLVSSIIKLFLCLSAGYGLDILLQRNKIQKDNKQWKTIVGGMALLFLGLSIFLFLSGKNKNLAKKFLEGLVEQSAYVPDHEQKLNIYIPGLIPYVDLDSLRSRLVSSSAFAFLLSVILILVLLFSGKSFLKYFIWALLLIHAIQIYKYKFDETKLKTIPLDGSLSEITQFQAMPFHVRRYSSFLPDKPRDAILAHLRYRPLYWSTNSFIFKDELGHFLRTDHWLKPFDQYLRAYYGQDIDDTSENPRGLENYRSLKFPHGHPAAAKISGATKNKIHFFKEAYALRDEKQISALMTHEKYSGDLLFLSMDQEMAGNVLEMRTWEEQVPLDTNERVSYPWQLLRFDANNLEIEVDIAREEKMWLLYSDVFNPLWRVYVNGREEDVYRGNLAYKAVLLKGGKNRIHFNAHSPSLNRLFNFWGMNSLFWVCIILFLFCRVILPIDRREDAVDAERTS